jgi:hypothetical protein
MTVEPGLTAVVRLTELGGFSAPRPPETEQPPPTTEPAPTQPPPILPSPSDTPVPLTPTDTLPAIPCNQAAFISDVTIPPGTQLLIGSAFTKIWRVMNSGSCTWTTAYGVVYTGGSLPPPAAVVLLSAPVSPGATVDVAVAMQTSAYPGDFLGLWMLRAADGSIFGAGPDATAPLEVRIRAIQPSFGGGAIFDLTANYCAATWTSTVGTLSCPSSSLDPRGSVMLLQSPVFETVQRSGYGLWARPSDASSGFINGQFPPYIVQSGDVFLAEIGCLQSSPGCALTFRLEYQTSEGQSGTLGIWQEDYNGLTTEVEISLSSLVGRSVWFNLRVINRGGWGAANAFWYQPRVQRGVIQSSAVLTWNRTGAPQPESCRELHIRMASFNSGVAEAYSCRGDLRQLGTRSLTASEVDQLREWLERLSETTAEIYHAPQPNPVIIWIDFHGLGGANASDTDLREMDRFAAGIFESIVP